MTNLLHFYKHLKIFPKRVLISVIGVTLFLALVLVNYDETSNNYLSKEVNNSITAIKSLPEHVPELPKKVLELPEIVPELPVSVPELPVRVPALPVRVPAFPEQVPVLPELVPVSKKWISMALCWGNRMDLYHKSQFPYALAGLLSTKLWQKFVNISVIFHIVVCDQAQIYDNYKLKDYIQDLEKTGAIVKIFYVENCDKCVLTAQLVRLLAYLSTKEVSVIFF